MSEKTTEKIVFVVFFVCFFCLIMIFNELNNKDQDDKLLRSAWRGQEVMTC